MDYHTLSILDIVQEKQKQKCHSLYSSNLILCGGNVVIIETVIVNCKFSICEVYFTNMQSHFNYYASI